MAHILPDRDLPGYDTLLGHPFPAGPNAEPTPTGWTCPACRHSYAPWVPECRHCPEPPAFTAKGNDPGPLEAGP